MATNYLTGALIIVLSATSLAHAQSLFLDGTGDEALSAYEEVRSDSSHIIWAAMKYDGKQVYLASTGDTYQDFLSLLTDDERVYGYVRFETGDEMSRRAKFAFITWIGSSVPPLKKAKVSTDKAFVKNIWTQFGKEILADEISEVKYEKVKDILEKASGAAYGTGTRALELKELLDESRAKEEKAAELLLLKRLLAELELEHA